MRLVMISGSAPGVGKTTLMRALVGAAAVRGMTAFAVAEDDVWGARELGTEPVSYDLAWPQFRALHELDRGATLDDVVNTFERVAVRLRGTADLWVQDWTWLDLVAMATPAWTSATHAGQAVTARQLATRMRDADPVLLYLAGSTEEALQRVTQQRGEVWLRRHVDAFAGAPSPGTSSAGTQSPGASVDELVAFAASVHGAQAVHRLALYQVGGWNTAVLDADAPASDVLQDALRALDATTGL